MKSPMVFECESIERPHIRFAGVIEKRGGEIQVTAFRVFYVGQLDAVDVTATHGPEELRELEAEYRVQFEVELLHASKRQRLKSYEITRAGA